VATYPPAPPPPPPYPPPPPPPAILRTVKTAAVIEPNVAFHEFVAVLSNCTETPTFISGYVRAVKLPLLNTDTPETPRRIAPDPTLIIVINVPIGKATEAFVGIVIACVPVLAE
jgi:hypothetical protein